MSYGDPATRPLPGPAEAVVIDNRDPQGLGRVKVEYVRLDPGTQSGWLRVMQPMAGDNRGFGVLPEIGDEVLVGFLAGDSDHAVVLGALHSGKDQPPYTNTDGENNKKVFRSRSGHQVVFDDTDGNEKIVIVDKTGKNLIVFESAKNLIAIEAADDISISAQGKIIVEGREIILEASATIELKAQKTVTVAAGTTVTFGSGGGVSFNAPKVSMN